MCLSNTPFTGFLKNPFLSDEVLLSKISSLFKETNHTARVQDMQASGLSLVQSSYLDRGVNPDFKPASYVGYRRSY